MEFLVVRGAMIMDAVRWNLVSIVLEIARLWILMRPVVEDMCQALSRMSRFQTSCMGDISIAAYEFDVRCSNIQ